MSFSFSWKVPDFTPELHSYDFDSRRWYHDRSEDSDDEVVKNVFAHFDPQIADLIGTFLNNYPEWKKAAAQHGVDVLSEMKARDLASRAEARNRAEQGVGPHWNHGNPVCTYNVHALFFHIFARKSTFDFILRRDENDFFRHIFKTEDTYELLLWCMRFEAAQEMTPRYPYLMYEAIVKELFKPYHDRYSDEVMSCFLFNTSRDDDGCDNYEFKICWMDLMDWDLSESVYIANVKKEHPIVQDVAFRYDWHIADVIGCFLESFPSVLRDAGERSSDMLAYMKETERAYIARMLPECKDPSCLIDRDVPLTDADIKELFPDFWDLRYSVGMEEASDKFSDMMGMLNKMLHDGDPEERLFWGLRVAAISGYSSDVPYSMYRAITEKRFEPLYDRYKEDTFRYFIAEEWDPYYGWGFDRDAYDEEDGENTEGDEGET